MAIRVKHKDWQNESFRLTILSLAETLQEDIEVELPKVKFKPYNASIWQNDDIVLEKDFIKKSDAMKWIKTALGKKKYSDAYCDLKKYNKRNDDFDWWYFKVIDNKLVEVNSPEGEL